MEKKEAIKVLASVSTVIAATGLASVANANQQEALKTEVDALSSKVTVQALKAAENKQSIAVQAVNAQQDVVKKAITEEEIAEKNEAMAKETIDEAQIIKDKATPVEIDKTKQSISETESAIENQDVQLQSAQAESAKAQDKVNKQTEIHKTPQTAPALTSVPDLPLPEPPDSHVFVYYHIPDAADWDKQYAASEVPPAHLPHPSG